MVNKIKNFRIKKRLTVSYVSILFFLAISMIMSIAGLLTIGSKVTVFYEHPYRVGASANAMSSEFERMQKSVFRALSNEDETITKESIADAKDASSKITEYIAVIEEFFLGDPTEVSNLKATLEKLAPMREHVLDLASQNKNVEAAAYMEKNNIVVIEEAQKQIDQIISDVNATGDNLIRVIRDIQTTDLIILLVLGAISFAISMAFAKLITNSITEPVDQLKTIAHNLATGVLDTSIITYQSEDELGALSHDMRNAMENLNLIIHDISFLMGEIAEGNLDVRSENVSAYIGEFNPILISMREMTDNVSDTIGSINDASVQVSTGSDHMAQSAQELAEGASEQAGAVEELNATIENVANAAHATAEDSKEASEQVNTSAKKAQRSRESMADLMEAMKRIDATSKEIGNIISAIEDIASQTNLLSLNASIEAARAGEAGRGFAVVADQIGKLATDSAQSAANTRELIMKTLEEINMGNHIAEDASVAFGTIIGDIEDFAKIAEKTSEKSIEQYNNLLQIREGVEQISEVVQSNSATAEETSATSEELAAQSENLKVLVERFQLKKK